ncbi:MAG: DNA repair protein RadA, partial [Woeseiaceae bacterium]|nr:DNA repair protein RadA [Woeseiaceae bacterium]NIP21451.1 DNA repair protein RadA [Woeseiaceae bacterium]
MAWEGSRALLVEVQALVAAGSASYPKRLAAGIDQARLNLLLAILQRHGQVELGTDDVFVNMVGGMRVADTSADLPVILSIISSWKDQRARQQLVSFGEVGLAGEVRP